MREITEWEGKQSCGRNVIPLLIADLERQKISMLKLHTHKRKTENAIWMLNQ